MTPAALLMALTQAAPGRAEKPSSEQAQPRLEAPTKIILGARRRLTLRLASLPGKGPPRFELNVGKLHRVKPSGAGFELRLRLPRRRAPKELLLLARRRRGPLLLYRLALHGRTRVLIRAKPRSTIVFNISGDEQRKKMGRRRRRRFRLLIPPRVDTVDVQVIDAQGQRTERQVKVHRPPYRRLLAAVTPEENSEAEPAFRLLCALAEGSKTRHPLAEVQAPDGAWRPLRGRIDASGTLRASFTPQHEGLHRLRVRHGEETREIEVRARYIRPRPRPTSRPEAPPKTPPPPPPPPRFAFDVSLAAGLLYNTGDMLTVMPSLAIGAAYRLGAAGSLGLRLGVGFARASQEIEARAAGLADAEASLMLLPLSLEAVYRGPPHWPAVPYTAAGFMLQLAFSRQSAPYAAERRTLETAPGVAARLGVEIPLLSERLAPFAEAAFLFSRIDSDDVEGLAGGLLFSLGLRLWL